MPTPPSKEHMELASVPSGFRVLSVRLPTGLVKQMQHAAIDHDRSLQDIVREACEQWIEKHSDQRH